VPRQIEQRERPELVRLIVALTESGTSHERLECAVPELVDRKIALLNQHFRSQADKPWFDDETFRAMLRLRGVECNSPTRYAEAFHCRKLLWTP
jgi:LmbE family N-acetylglucosaminyl deacetylase